MADRRHAALVLVGHGSARNRDSRLPTERLAEQIRARGLFAEVHACFLKEPPLAETALAGVTAREIFVVPNFAGAGHLSQVALPRAMGLTGPVTEIAGRRVHYAEPVGSHPRIPGLLRRRLETLAADAGLDAGKTAVLVVGHGSPHAGSAATPEAVAAALRAGTGFAEIVTAYLEQEPRVADWPALVGAANVLVARLLVAEGLHGSEDLPPLFGLARGATGPAHIHGRRVWMTPGIGSDPEVVEIILDRVRACG